MRNNFSKFPPLRRDGSLVELCDLFMTRSADTWQLLRRARISRVALKEESITDLHLLAFSEAAIDGFWTRAISRHEEREVGADYEWWFGDKKGRWVGLRVQAKKIDHDERFRSLNYKPSGASVPQSSALIVRCRREGLLPAYCLYTYSVRSLEPMHGCSIFSPMLVARLPVNQIIPLNEIQYSLVPWTALVCPAKKGRFQPTRPPTSLVDVVIGGWADAIDFGDEASRIGVLDIGSLGSEDFTQAAIKERPPSYVAAMMDPASLADADGLLREIGIRALLAIREVD